ncbi:ATP-binding protein [Streptomyces longispororuber]|uniref:ATP-binding protein n=1 Tax=Streptomyces longispororuber TaxID=68230 RepID=UPI00210D442F|nr:ATP-binding protein [Streptomyces longispororuber]MCQ4206468.1 ATP-binding protein [Streptomyces longispororuber]
MNNPGTGERLLVATLGRYGVWLRCTVACVCGALGLVSAEAADVPVALCLLVPALLACVVRVRTLRRPLPLAPRWGLDASMVVLIGLSQPVLGHDADLMVEAIIGISVISFQHEWATPPVAGLSLAALGAATCTLGDLLSSPGHLESASLMRMFLEASLSRAAHVIVRSRAARADRTAASQAASRREAAVTAARRATEREYLATLHDTAAATLLMVYQGDGRDWSWLPSRARKDLEALSALPDLGAESVDLAVLLACVPEGEGRARVHLTSHVDGPLTIPSGPGLAIFNGVREAVTNVARHAGVREAKLRAWAEDGGIVVELSDAGRGFEPESVPERRRGLTGSIIGRMHTVGGSASITSRPGAGTRIQWRWHRPIPESRPSPPVNTARAPALPCPPDGREQPTASVRLIRGQLLHGARLAALLISLVVQFGASLRQLTAHHDAYRPAWAQTAAFVCLAFVTATAAGQLLRGRQITSSARRWGMGTVLSVSVVCAFTLPPEHLTGPQDWAFGLVGWHALFFLMDRPIRLFIAFLAAHVGLTVLVVLLSGAPTAAETAVVGISTVSVIGFQLSVGALTHLFHDMAARAGTESARQEKLRTRERIHEQMQHDHRERYRTLTATTVPLLVGLGHGALSPRDEEVRLRCGVEAARMRRLFAEGDAVTDPLLNEVRACVEVAEHQGVTVNLAVRGRPGEVPVEIRRELVDPVAVILGRTRSTARVTVVWTPRAVHVSVVSEDCADGCEPTGPVPAHERSTNSDVTVARTIRGQDVWVAASWERTVPAQELTPT